VCVQAASFVLYDHEIRLVALENRWNILFSRSHECTRLRLRAAGGKLAALIGASELMILLFMYRKLCFGLAALIASFLAGCSTVESRIKSNPQIYDSFSPADQALVRQRQIREGMPKPLDSSPGAIPIGFGPEYVWDIRSRPGFTQPRAVRFYQIIITTPVFTDLDIFAAGFGGIIAISILLVSIRIPSTRIRT